MSALFFILLAMAAPAIYCQSFTMPTIPTISTIPPRIGQSFKSNQTANQNVLQDINNSNVNNQTFNQAVQQQAINNQNASLNGLQTSTLSTTTNALGGSSTTSGPRSNGINQKAQINQNANQQVAQSINNSSVSNQQFNQGVQQSAQNNQSAVIAGATTTTLAPGETPSSSSFAPRSSSLAPGVSTTTNANQQGKQYICCGVLESGNVQLSKAEINEIISADLTGFAAVPSTGAVSSGKLLEAFRIRLTADVQTQVAAASQALQALLNQGGKGTGGKGTGGGATGGKLTGPISNTGQYINNGGNGGAGNAGNGGNGSATGGGTGAKVQIEIQCNYDRKFNKPPAQCSVRGLKI